MFSYLYVFMQSFAIPGTIFLSVISGSLWNSYWALIITSLCATFGSSICFILSQNYLKGYFIKKYPQKITNFLNLSKFYESKFVLILILRFTPLVPNVLVNVFCPIIGMNLLTFFSGTLIGLLPMNFVHV